MLIHTNIKNQHSLAVKLNKKDKDFVDKVNVASNSKPLWNKCIF